MRDDGPQQWPRDLTRQTFLFVCLLVYLPAQHYAIQNDVLVVSGLQHLETPVSPVSI